MLYSITCLNKDTYISGTILQEPISICMPKSKLLPLPLLNLKFNLIQPNFYLVSSVFIYYNGLNKKPTGKSFKKIIN